MVQLFGAHPVYVLCVWEGDGGMNWCSKTACRMKSTFSTHSTFVASFTVFCTASDGKLGGAWEQGYNLCELYYMYVVAFFFSDERENPDDIPEFELKTRGDQVMSINYSFLWQHLEPSRLLPKLVDKLLMTEAGKQEAESYRQKFAQNAVIIYQLFGSHCSPLKLCDTLDVTGQEHIARKLLQGT